MSNSQPIACIDLSALTRNYGEVRRLIGPRIEILAMVKADAYGHGAVEVAKALAGVGCGTFGVANLEEAAQVTGVVSTPRVVVFGGLLPDDAGLAADLGVEVVTQEMETVRAVGAAAVARGAAIGLHLKVDTGMHRLGVTPQDAIAWLGEARAVRGVRIVGLCSHFAMAESVTTTVTAGQIERLTAVADLARAAGWSLQRHIANSAAIMTLPHAHLDMVRPGLMLYGLYPHAQLRGRVELHPVMTLDAPIVRVTVVGPGEGIGYGHSYRAVNAMRLATIRCGYADGYPRSLSNRGEVLLRGIRVPVVGTVCMDHVMIDVTAVDSVRVGDRVQLWGPGLDTADVAATADTISYELVARVGPRVQRRYRAARSSGEEEA